MGSESSNEGRSPATETGKGDREKRKKSYEPPRILSVEPLEAVAAVCDPPTGGFGKSVPACNPTTLGS